METSSPDQHTLAELRSLIEDGRYLSGWDLARPHAPIEKWTGCEAVHLAARLATWLGNWRLGTVLHLLNARRFPDNHEAFFAGVLRRIALRGPASVLDDVDIRLASGPADPGHRADLLGARASIFGHLHDFDSAHSAMDEALSLAPADSWLHVQRSRILETQDHYENALAAAREAVRLAPHSPVAILQLSDCLIHEGEDAEAMSLLEREHQRGELADYAECLVNLHSEREEPEKALHYLDEHDRRSPLLSSSGKAWSDRRRADFLYLAGDFEESLRYCDKAQSGFHRRVAVNLRIPGALARRRRRLAVAFVRQHRVTCAPATLAALAGYWSVKHDHLEIADAICYDGTPWHKERAWAESNGFVAVEFRLSREGLSALIDRDIPFTLTTESVANSHLQACIGYDERQGTVLLRDPTQRHYGEALAEGLVEDHPVSGPRCMTLVPQEKASLLEGTFLPDSEVYEDFHKLSVALDAHDRPGASAILESMPAAHPLTARGRLRLAGYDRNPLAELRAIDSLLERFPDNALLRYWRLGALQRCNDTPGERDLLRGELARQDCDPIYYSEMGEFLTRDARQLPLADYYLRKAVRLRRRTAGVYASLASCRWKERRFEDAARYRRIASCLTPEWEPYAAAYAENCRVIGRPRDGLAFLEKRVGSLGAKSAAPWRTLAEELDAQALTTRAIEVLDRAFALRPDDGELMLDAGRLFSRWGAQERGTSLMMAARGKVREGQWQREMAQSSVFFGKRDEALAHWRELLNVEPDAIDAYRSIARLVAEGEGIAAASNFLAEATSQHPHHPVLWALRAEWQALLGPAEAIPSLEKALSLEPDYMWAMRELAVQRLGLGEDQAALEIAQEGLRKDPHSPASHGILGNVLEGLSRREEACICYREAIRREVDYTFASERLMQIAADAPAKRSALRFIESEMHRQVSDGRIVPEYRELAYPHLERSVLLEQLRAFCEERPDLWQTWAARADQARDMDLPEEASRCATELVERFPLMPRAWMEMARAHHATGNYEKEIEMLRRAVALSPAWGWAVRQLSEALERTGRYDEALTALERNLHLEPLSGASHGYLADLLWKRGRREEGFARLLDGMRNCPSYSWGWETLAAWSLSLKREDEVVAAMEAHRKSRAHVVSWWIQCASVLDTLGRKEQALSVIDEGLTLHPAESGLFEKKAELLASAGRFDEASAECGKGLAANPAARNLQGREAWLLMQSGRPNAAISRMTRVVEEHPDYLWGLARLAAWLDERSRWNELRDLSLKWIRQDPQSHLAYGNLAEAEKGLDHREEARAALERAFQLNPEYAYAGRMLLSYQIEDREFEAAEQTLRTLEHYASSAAITADAVELALGRNDAETALERARQLLLHKDVSVQLLAWMKDLFAKSGHLPDWWTLLDAQALQEGVPSPAVLEAWIRSLPGRHNIVRAARRLDALSGKAEDVAAVGWVALLDCVDTQKDRLKARWWVWKHRHWFRSRTDLWAAAGNTLTNLRAYRASARWFHDWEERRQEASCEALFDAGVAFQHVFGWRRACAVREAALARHPTHTLAWALRAIVTLQTALKGDLPGAAQLATQVETEKLTKYYGGCYSLYRSIAAADCGEIDAAATNYRDAWSTLNQFDFSSDLKGIFRDATALIASRVPWAAGKPGKIRKKWGTYTGPAKSTIRWWLIAISLYFLLRIILGMTGHYREISTGCERHRRAFICFLMQLCPLPASRDHASVRREDVQLPDS